MIMATNLEWMYENDRETLISMITGDCGNCKFDSNCYAGDYRCTHRWLEAEYEELDSWEKAEWDACNIARKISEHYGDANLSNEICMIFDRCKKLAGVE